ncbi:hypothetical protein [Streptomyces scopuliridis]
MTGRRTGATSRGMGTTSRGMGTTGRRARGARRYGLRATPA